MREAYTVDDSFGPVLLSRVHILDFSLPANRGTSALVGHLVPEKRSKGVKPTCFPIWQVVVNADYTNDCHGSESRLCGVRPTKC
jgi:hypothetical protein